MSRCVFVLQSTLSTARISFACIAALVLLPIPPPSPRGAGVEELTLLVVLRAEDQLERCNDTSYGGAAKRSSGRRMSSFNAWLRTSTLKYHLIYSVDPAL
jgi:hypothetical protein